MKKSKLSPYSIFLIEGIREWFLVLSVLIVVFLCSLGIKYYQYLQIDFSKPQEITAQVLLQYQKEKPKKLKNGSNIIEKYFVLKLIDSNSNVFYTISKEDIKSILNRYVRLYGQVKKCSFIEFMKSCYVSSYTLSLLHKRDFRDKIRDFIDSQHKEFQDYLPTGNLYRALFIADALNKDWREISNKLGLAHIIAISGFHLGILSAFLYILFFPIYRFFQRKYFPYRNQAYDLGALILCFMFGYLLLLDYQPSFFRSFVMAAIGFLLYFSGIRLLSFSLLFFVFLFCISLSPVLLLNVGFLLSISGVFYIFLFIKYFPKIHASIYAVFFSLLIFLDIAPIVHYFFPYFSPYQLISILVGFLFIAFFPLSLVLHLFGLGWVFDKFLLQALLLNPPYIQYYSPWWFILFYASLSVIAIWSKISYWILNVFGLGFFIFLLLKYL